MKLQGYLQTEVKDPQEWLHTLVLPACTPSMIQEWNQIHQRALPKMDNAEKVL
jgi:hypothetical protein